MHIKKNLCNIIAKTNISNVMYRERNAYLFLVSPPQITSHDSLLYFSTTFIISPCRVKTSRSANLLVAINGTRAAILHAIDATIKANIVNLAIKRRARLKERISRQRLDPISISVTTRICAFDRSTVGLIVRPFRREKKETEMKGNRPEL